MAQARSRHTGTLIRGSSFTMQLDLSDAVQLIAEAALAGPSEHASVVERIVAVVGADPPWCHDVATLAVQRFAYCWREASPEDLALLIVDVPAFAAAWSGVDRLTFVRVLKRVPTQVAPPVSLAHISIPLLPTLADLADWLELRSTDLEWLADRWRVEGHARRLHHYGYHACEKRDGRYRLIERPKPLLRSAQHKILHQILDHIPVHAAAHGFCKRRNIVSFAAPHAGQAMVLSFDLQDFFSSVTAGRVHAIFRTLGYPFAVARAITALTTNRVPSAYFDAPPLRGKFTWHERERLRARHLPQGAATSPALANLCAFRLDMRLSALARALGARYTRYADDLAFSGGSVLARASERLSIQVAAIALEEGFEVHSRKTHGMPRGVRQQLAGVVINRHPNLARDCYDRCKAVLHNCALHGPASQNREAHGDFRAHLMGKVAHATMLNPRRGAKLKVLFDRIIWPEDAPARPPDDGTVHAMPQ